jgi:hypothetical protein
MLKFFLPSLLFSSVVFSQNVDAINLADDLIKYTGMYIAPATDAVVYQGSSAWMITPKLKEKWKFSLGVNTNLFFIPKSNREFAIRNSDFKIFNIVGVNDNSPVNVPTAYGGASAFEIEANFDLLGPQYFKTSLDGINQEYAVYPYLHGALSLPYGFEIMGRFSLRQTRRSAEQEAYAQVYGAALQYNISQHFPKLAEKNIHIAALFAYNKEILGVDLFSSSVTLNTIGLKGIASDINSFQFQLNASKTFNKFEVMAGLIVNNSAFSYNYLFYDNRNLLIEQLMNTKVTDLNSSQTIFLGELSGRYNFYNNFFLQGTISAGSLINTNLGLQYEFN